MPSDYDDFPFYRYTSVSELRSKASRRRKELVNQGYEISPIEAFSGTRIAKSFWGHNWCRHLESFSDYSNRLPRGRSYVRNGMVCHLKIESGRVEALVSGSELYEVEVRIDPLPKEKWDNIKRLCGGKIGTLLELLQGRLSDEVMSVVTDRKEGLFPSPKEIGMSCNCPDWADLCKHLAAVLYGVGTRLDDEPELLFLLRGVDKSELIGEGISAALDESAKPGSKRRRLAKGDVSSLFGIDLDSEASTTDHEKVTETGARPAEKEKDSAGPKPKKRSARARRNEPKTPRTGGDVRKLRRKFGMSEWEFGFMIDVSATTVRNWEAKGREPVNARSENQEALREIAALTTEQAWTRLNEYL